MHVEFDTGGQDWTGPLAWGQRSIWDAIQDVGPAGDQYFNFSVTVPVPRKAPAADVATVLAALRAVVERHDSLRTRVRTAADGEPYQVVAARGAIPVAVVESAADARRLEETRFDFAEEWPLRAALVAADGRVREVVLVFGHVAADGAAGDLVARDLRLMLLRGRLPAPAEQLRELVAAQAEQDVPRSERALDHWARHVTGGPLFDRSRDPDGGWRYRQAALVSPALDRASRVLARRHGLTGATVLLSAATVLAGRIAGQAKAVMTPLVNNRFLARHGDVVTSLAQLGLFPLGTGGTDFGGLLTEAKTAAMHAYRNAYYDHVAFTAKLGAANPLCCFNDQRPAETTAVLLPEPAGAAGETVLEQVAGLDELNCRFCVHVTGEPGRLRILATADTRYFAARDLEDFLYGMESLVVGAADGG